MKNLFHKLGSFVLIFSFVFALSGSLFLPTANAIVCPEGQSEWNGTCRTTTPNFDPITGVTKWVADKATDALFLTTLPMTSLIFQLSQFLLWLSGGILNSSVVYSVVDMKANIDAAGSVNNAWKMVRDVCNMAFIFILVYAAIQQILGIGKGIKELIVRIIVVAVLINFSLFFTKFVIDISNILAMMFYDAIVPGAMSRTLTFGLSEALMAPLNLQTMFSDIGILQGKRIFIAHVMGTVFVLVATFVFFSIALMFIIRFVVLMLVLVLSPIAFIASILPQAEKYQKQWLDALLGQAFFAPIYFMITWIVIILSRGVLNAAGPGAGEWSFGRLFNGITSSSGAVAASPSDIGIVVNFLVLITLMVASLTIAKEWANRAGPGVSKLTNWATGFAGGATLGVAGWASRNTIGRGADAMANNQDLKDKAAAGSLRAKLQLAAARKVAGSSMDFRATGIGGGIAGMTGAGKAGGKGGFTDYKKKKAEDEAKYAASLAPGDEVTDMAEQELKRLKESQPEIFEQERLARREELRAELRILRDQRNDETDPVKKAEYQSRLNETQDKFDQTEDAESYQKFKVRLTQNKVNKLKGVKPDEVNKQHKAIEAERTKVIQSDENIKKEKELEEKIAEVTKKRAEAERFGLTSEINTLNEELVRLEDEKNVISKAAKKSREEVDKTFDKRKAEIKVVKSVGDERKENYANTVQKSRLARFMGYNTAAAAQIRKGKSKEKKLTEAVEALTKKEDEAPAEAAPEATPPTS